MVVAAEVWIWGVQVGAVLWDDAQQLGSFQYDRQFLERGWELSPIHMPIKNGSQIYTFPQLRKQKDETVATFKGLPGLLADMLPDRYGNQLINLWLAQNDRPPNSMNPVEQLCFIGSRGMGALEFKPSRLTAGKVTLNLEIGSLVDVAKMMLDERQQLKSNLKVNDQQAVKELLKIGTSAGGARPKAVIAYNQKTGEIRSGQAQAPSGFEHWLIKLDGVSGTQFGETHGFGRVEYAYYLMAKAAGMQMSKCKLLEENGRAHFMTKRFDREGKDTRFHVQTFCAIRHFDYNQMNAFSYEQLFQTMRALRLTYPEAEEMFRRMVFNVLAINYDDHTKNFSFRMKQGGRWELSPAYDICFSYDASNVWVNKQTLSINGKRQGITRSDLMSLAKANNVKKATRIIDEVAAAVGKWDAIAGAVGVKGELARAIGEACGAARRGCE